MEAHMRNIGLGVLFGIAFIAVASTD